MRKLRVGINGFGRIGRAVFRINLNKDYFDVVAINDINPDTKNMAYLLKYDTTYGKLNRDVGNDLDEDYLVLDDKKIKIYHEKNVLDVPWDEQGVDVVIESSGVKANLLVVKNSENRKGVKNFIFTNAPGEGLHTVIFGVNDDKFKPEEHTLISSSICDTISLSPIIKLIKETHDIESGFLITLHPWLSYQNLLDGPSASWSQPGDVFSHYALGRSSVQNIIPKSTSAVLAADHVFDGLSDKIQSFSYRIPTGIVSSATLILQLDKDITPDELSKKFYDFEKAQSFEVIKNSMEPLTSVDYTGENHSAVIDHRWTKVNNGNHIKLMYWYDNEWGYSSRVVDIVKKISDHYLK